MVALIPAVIGGAADNAGADGRGGDPAGLEPRPRAGLVAQAEGLGGARLHGRLEPSLQPAAAAFRGPGVSCSVAGAAAGVVSWMTAVAVAAVAVS